MRKMNFKNLKLKYFISLKFVFTLKIKLVPKYLCHVSIMANNLYTKVMVNL